MMLLSSSSSSCIHQQEQNKEMRGVISTKLLSPSFLALGVGGLLVFVAVVLLFLAFQGLNSFQIIVIVLLLSVAISVHGNLHERYEERFNWNPLRND
jgi:hypothetical protein